MFELINDFRHNWKQTRRSRASTSRADSVDDSQAYFDPIYRKKNRRIRKFMKEQKQKIDLLFPQLFELRNTGRHYFIWHPHWPVFRRVYGTKLRSFYVDNSMFINDTLSFLPELSRFLFRVGVIRNLFKQNQTEDVDAINKHERPNENDENLEANRKRRRKQEESHEKDPLTDTFVEEKFLKTLSKLELKKVLEKDLKLKPRFAKLVTDFVQQSLFLQFGATGFDKNVTQTGLKKFLANRFDSKSLLQTIRDFKYKGKYFIPVMTEDI